MKIALINENTQKKRNEFIYEILTNVAKKYGHTVYNYGVRTEDDYELDYVGAGVLTALLINTKAVDLVITGCNSAEGLLFSNMFPNVFCGYVRDSVDAMLCLKTNKVNVISLPFGKMIGIGMQYELEQIFETLFNTIPGSGFPSNRKEIQKEQRKQLKELSHLIKLPMYDIVDKMDKDLLKKIISNDYFMEHFFVNSIDDDINDLLLSIIDA